MDNRKKVAEQIILDVPVSAERRGLYKPGILWSELVKTEGVLPTDAISEIGYREEENNGFGTVDIHDVKTCYIPTLVVMRSRDETDEEYLSRKREDEERERAALEKDRLDYLRLKAKFEP